MKLLPFAVATAWSPWFLVPLVVASIYYMIKSVESEMEGY